MLREIRRELNTNLQNAVHRLYGLDCEPVLETPPRRELGDISSPTPLHLAKPLRQKPRAIAESLAAALDQHAAVARVTVEGAGYLNFHLRRPAFTRSLLEGPGLHLAAAPQDAGKVIVEHTNINPNKAAHIGHLRNAVLGDVLARSLRALGFETEVQNYIDDTGVQVADVVIGFLDIENYTLEQIAAAPEPFDYLCWDIYSRVGPWYEEDPSRQVLRRQTLHELESGRGPRAETGRLVARRILGRHLETMKRLGIGYDLLTRESEILRLRFFQTAFERLQTSGAVRLETAGKNVGCWVMPLSESAEFQGLEDADKVIVRSDGTITYVGKDIAYQMWKFGVLGDDFEYALWDENEPHLWETRDGGERFDPARFGQAKRVVNVIDARQSYLQKIVRAGLESLGHAEEARHSVHFAYEMVSLSNNTARALGFLGEGEEGRSLEMSGRRGIGVKADDLLDQLEQKSREEIAKRDREHSAEELGILARQIATAALRFFMVKATTTRVIAFDLEQALSFEGDSGPYLQYSAVRARNIRRRLAEAGLSNTVVPTEIGDDLEWPDDLWDLVLASAQIGDAVEKATASLELSLIARAATDLAQRFHAIYHRYPILREENPQLRAQRLAAIDIFDRALTALTDLLGIPLPDRM